MFGSSPFRSIFGHAESTHVNRPKGKALLALKRNRNNWICDKYAQPVGLNEKMAWSMDASCSGTYLGRFALRSATTTHKRTIPVREKQQQHSRSLEVLSNYILIFFPPCCESAIFLRRRSRESALQSEYHDPQLDVTELSKTEQASSEAQPDHRRKVVQKVGSQTQSVAPSEWQREKKNFETWQLRLPSL